MRQLRREPLAAFGDSGERLRRAVAPRLGDTQALLRLRDLLRRIAELADGIGDGGFERGQAGLCLCFVGCRSLACGERVSEPALRGFLLAVERRLLARQRANRFGELRHLFGEPRLVFARKRELLLEPRHLGVGRVERALPCRAARRRPRNARSRSVTSCVFGVRARPPATLRARR